MDTNKKAKGILHILEKPITDDGQQPMLSGTFSARTRPSVVTLRAVIYARVSTQEQAEGKASIPDQLEICHTVLQKKGWLYVQEYTDAGVSGHLTEERHGLQSMLRDAKAHTFDLIIVKDYDRFARNKDAAGVIRMQLKELGIQTYAVNTPVEPRAPSDYDPDEDQLGTIIETISDMRADLERKAILQRMKMGKTRQAHDGKIPNAVPYGYSIIRTIEGSKIKRSIVVNEEAAPRVRFIFNEYARGLGDRKIAIQMNKKGWKSPKGRPWSIAAVRYILANPTYAGKVLWGWRHANYSKTKEWRRRGKVGYIGAGLHEPIIDEKLFNIVQEIRARRGRISKGNNQRSFGLLTGIAKCIRCRSGVGYQKRFHTRSRHNPQWHDTVTYEYICTGYKYHGICSQRVMSAEKLEGEVLNHIKNLYAHPKVQEQIIYDGKNQDDIDREKDIARLEREIAQEPVKMQRQHEAYERGILSIEEYEANVARIREETAKSRTDRGRLLTQSSLTAQRAASIQKLVASFKDFDALWEAMELHERKLILRSIIAEIRAGNGRVEIDFIL